MFKNFKWNRILMFAPLMTLMFCFNAPKNDDEKMQTIMVSVKNTLSYLHYAPKPINDAYSVEVYNKFFESADPDKRIFLQSDMEEFSKHKTKLDDYIINGDLTFYKATTNRLYQRMDEIDKMTQDILSKPIDLDEEDSMIVDVKKKKNAVNSEEQKAEWKRYVKYYILREMETLNSKEESAKKTKDSLVANKLKDTVKLNILSASEKRIKAQSEVKDLITDMFRRYKKRKQNDWFTVYMNAYTEVFDPHTNYFSPKDKEDFDTNFSGKIIGIGAIIQEKKGYLFLGDLTIGAPAWKSKQLTKGDKILKVKSKPKDDFVNVVGMLSDEAVRLIRGEKGSPVTLTVEKTDGSIKDVTLVREEVVIEDTYARSSIINSPNGKKLGYIYLPGFYADFENSKGRNASDDVKAELLKLKALKVEGIVLDLRNNGGGSLTEVVDMMGLFINAGPVVQVKDGSGKINVLNNKSNSPVWTGPLVLMQNELSASASEILAGAMQDYGRAAIIGSPQSFGKGTVQSFVSLNRFLNSSDDFGDLKLTIQKYYRITGESTQRKGVESDVKMQDLFTYAEIGERYDQFALPWDKIAPAKFNKVKDLNTAALQTSIDSKIKNNINYQLLIESAKWRESLSKEEKVTLNETKYMALMKERKAQIDKFKALDKYTNGLKISLHADEVAREKKDEVFAKKSENWIKNLQKDFYLKETLDALEQYSK